MEQSAAHAKHIRLREILAEFDSALVCFSGGVDSTFLLHAAAQVLGPRVVALTAQSPSLPARELSQARALAEQFGVRHLLRDTLEIHNADYTANPQNRCYFCKTELLGVAARVAGEEHVATILLGTNADDLKQHRPGLKAAQEHHARHPLAEAGLTKSEVRDLARAAGLPIWDKPEMACLASRFPYGTRITQENLDRVERFENALNDLGFRGLRVRFHDPIARIELPDDQIARCADAELRRAVVRIGKELGFTYVSLDLEGYRRGAMNEAA